MKPLCLLALLVVCGLMLLDQGEGAKRASPKASGVSSKAGSGASKGQGLTGNKSPIAKPPAKGRASLAAKDDDDDDDDEDDEDYDKDFGDDEDEDGLDDDEEEEDLEEEEEEPADRPRSRRGRKAPDWHYSDKRRRPAKKGYGVFGLVKGAAKLTGNSVSSMVGLFQPNKYVGLREIVGTWKIKQKVADPSGELVRCEATVEIRRDGTISTFFKGKELKSEYLFKERQWPRTCIIEFEAKAFQGPYDREPQAKFYKGYVKRSMIKRGLIRIEGKIYDVKGTFFWRQKQQVGRFRATKKTSR